MNRGLAALVPQRRLLAPPSRTNNAASAASVAACPPSMQNAPPVARTEGQAAGLPATDNSNAVVSSASVAGIDEEVDPLDAFMSSVQQQLQKAPLSSKTRPATCSGEGQGASTLPGEAPWQASAETSSGRTQTLVHSSLAEDSDEGQGADYWSYAAKSGGKAEGGPRGQQRKAGSQPQRQEQDGDDDDDEEMEDDSRLSGTHVKRKREEDISTVLRAIDHSKWQYSPLQRTLVLPSPDGPARPPHGNDEDSRAELGITAVMEAAGSLAAIPAPARSFMHLQLDGHACWPSVVRCMASEGWEAPTAIQAQALPALLAGAHVLGLAATGQGKTVAYALPAVLHAYTHRQMHHATARAEGQGQGKAQSAPFDCPKGWDSAPSPLSLILCPTRELAQQVYETVRKLARSAGLSTVLTIGGAGKWAQACALRDAEKSAAGGKEGYGPHIVVATPGRLIDHARDGTVSLCRTGLMVLDEADRLLELGFGPQVTSLCSSVRPDRQVALFSATWPRKVQALASAVVTPNGRSSIRIAVGHEEGEGGQAEGGTGKLRIVQRLVHTPKQEDKWAWLQANLRDLMRQAACIADGALSAQGDSSELRQQVPVDGSVVAAAAAAPRTVRTIIFVSSKDGCDQLCTSLNGSVPLRQSLGIHPAGRVARALHGGHLHQDREAALQAFRSGAVPVLVATDVASRGLDIADVGCVLSYDAPRSLETHTHRIGRTGRLRAAGQGGTGTGEVVPGLAVTLLTQDDKGISRDIVRSLEDYQVFSHAYTGMASAGSELQAEAQAVSAPSRGLYVHTVDAVLDRLAGAGNRGYGGGEGGRSTQQQFTGLGAAVNGGSSDSFLQASLGWAQNPLTAGARSASSSAAPAFVRASTELSAQMQPGSTGQHERTEPSVPALSGQADAGGPVQQRVKRSRWGDTVVPAAPALPAAAPGHIQASSAYGAAGIAGHVQSYRAPPAAVQAPLAASRALYQPGVRY